MQAALTQRHGHVHLKRLSPGLTPSLIHLFSHRVNEGAYLHTAYTIMHLAAVHTARQGVAALGILAGREKAIMFNDLVHGARCVPGLTAWMKTGTNRD